MMNAIIIDDEMHCLDRLSYLLGEYCGDQIQITGRFQTYEEGMEGINLLKPDLVFLDVQLKTKTGFDLLRALPSIPFHIVFTTAHDQYAVQAFRFSAVDFLLKPVDAQQLQEAVEKALAKPAGLALADQVSNLLYNLKATANPQKRIAVPTTNGYAFIPVADIIRCQSEINYTTIHLKNKEKLTVAKTLREYEDLLSPYHFFRVHNSHLINLAYIKQYTRGKGGTITMTDNSSIEVSTRRKEEFLKKLNDL